MDSVSTTDDGYFYVGGMCGVDSTPWVYKLRGSQLIWDSVGLRTGNARPLAIGTTTDDGCLLASYGTATKSTGVTATTTYIYKYDVDGNLEWRWFVDPDLNYVYITQQKSKC
jgi:hypothetical protein